LVNRICRPKGINPQSPEELSSRSAWEELRWPGKTRERDQIKKRIEADDKALM
jgi:hypothetical protein